MASKVSARAYSLLNRAVEAGQLARPDTCELCGSKTCYGRLSVDFMKRPVVMPGRYNLIVAHHYAGYEGANALKVWWVCQKCNSTLRGRHDGSLTKEQAIELVKQSVII